MKRSTSWEASRYAKNLKLNSAKLRMRRYNFMRQVCKQGSSQPTQMNYNACLTKKKLLPRILFGFITLSCLGLRLNKEQGNLGSTTYFTTNTRSFCCTTRVWKTKAVFCFPSSFSFPCLLYCNLTNFMSLQWHSSSSGSGANNFMLGRRHGCIVSNYESLCSSSSSSYLHVS